MLYKFIKNSSELLTKDLHKNQYDLRKIGLIALEKAINAVKPKNLISESVKIENQILKIQNKKFDLNLFQNIYIIGAGKATAEMAKHIEKILIDANFHNIKGFINIPENLKSKEKNNLRNIKINYASHPVPNKNGLYGTRTMIELIKKALKNDLIICLISGGGSALLSLPKVSITLEDLQIVNHILLDSGASIHEINTIRKHLSDVKGGNLARQVYQNSGSTLISLIISDVVGDRLESIASGPTVPDSTTFRDAFNILNRYNLIDKFPSSAIALIKDGMENNILENPKPDNDCFFNVYNFLIGSVKKAVDVIIDFFMKDGYVTDYFSNQINGEAKEFGENLYNIFTEKINQSNLKKKKIALIGSGELTVTIKGKGIGGRNQEMLLSFLNQIGTLEINNNFLVIAANLDGIEGNSNAMGALVDNQVIKKVTEYNLNLISFLDNNDSNSFFKALYSEIITGPTGVNVNDIILVLIDSLSR